MKCIFCKRDSSSSRSVEHIIPESLGNSRNILSKGIVCDHCNNYLAREVEKPFLDHEAIRLLRFEEGILSKKGKVPPTDGVIIGDGTILPITLQRSRGDNGRIESFIHNEITVGDELVPVLKRMGPLGKIIVPQFNVDLMPAGSIVSRFLGKVAIEVMAQKVEQFAEGIEYIANHEQLDDLRDHVRLGTRTEWPYSVRQIYSKNVPMVDDESGELFQTLYEYDLLVTKYNEYYLVLIIFGVEFAINMGGSEISGYHTWLEEHGNQSPLYVDKSTL